MKNVLRRNIFIIATVSIFLLLGMAMTALFRVQSSAAENASGNARVEEVRGSCDGDHTGFTPLLSVMDSYIDINDTTGAYRYYLTQNTKILGITINTKTPVVLCLNGYILYGSAASVINIVDSEANFELCDCKSQSTAAEHRHYYTENSRKVRKFTDGAEEFLTTGEADKCVVGGVVVNKVAGASDGVGVNNGGTFTMTGGTISGGIASNCGGGVYNNGTFTMSGGAISGNSVDGSGNGGGVYNSGVFTMSGGAISENSSYNKGGGVYNSGTFTMTGGAISGNTATIQGGGVYNGEHDSTGTFTLNGGEISDNSAGFGGGVYGKFIMNGGEVCRNTAGTSGGGVLGFSTEINGGTIGYNSAPSGYGGGVYNQSGGGAFNMTGGEISHNTAEFGGGVYDAVEFIISGGSICYNSATQNGGGVYLYQKKAQLSGGEICNNTVNGSSPSADASGFYVGGSSESEIKIHGSPVISGNYLDNGTERLLRNVVFSGAIYSVYFTVNGELNRGADIGICFMYYMDLDRGAFAITSGYDSYNHGSAATDFFSTDNHLALCNKDGEVALTDVYKLTLNLYKNMGGKYVVDTEHTSYRYSAAETVLPVPARVGYFFDGWYDNAQYTGQAVTGIPANTCVEKVFYAKWKPIPQNDLFGGDDIKFTQSNIWDCQRIPAFPLDATPFYVFGLAAPLDVTGRTIAFNDGDYVKFELYSGDGGAAVDTDGNGVITVGELSESDRDRIADTLYGCSNATSKQAILDGTVVSEIKYDKNGNRTALANIGLIWALGEDGFLYTALDPDCPWSYSGGVGTFITFRGYDADDGLSYIPDSSDPLGKEDLDKDENGDNVLPVPVPQKNESTDDVYCAFGIVVDENDDPLTGAAVQYQGFDVFDTSTDGNGYFLFSGLGMNEWAAGFSISVKYGSYASRTYNLTSGGESIGDYSIIRLVYPLNGGDAGYSNEVIAGIKYMNMDGATFGGDYPVSYVQGVGASLAQPSKQCYAFGGWYENEGLAGAPVTAISSERTGDITLYAKWTVNHAWGEPVWTWTKNDDGGYSAEAKFTCANDPSHTQTPTATVTSATVPATCTEKGSMTFTATVAFNGRDYTDTKVEETPALGHTWGEWTVTKQPSPDSDGEQSRVCSVCGETETRAIEYDGETSSLLWLIILLAVILAAEIIVLALRIRARKKQSRGGTLSVSVLPLLAASYPMGEIVAVAVLASAVVALGICIACTFVKKKDGTAQKVRSADAPDEENSAESQMADGQTTDEQAVDSHAADESSLDEHTADGQAIEERKETVAETERNDEQTQLLEREVASELETDGSGGAQSEGMSLKESLALAAAHSQIRIDKRSIADWLNKNFGDAVTLNRRANATKTGLPLADTHFVDTGAKKKCFIYVYELAEGKTMLLLKTDDETAKEIADKHPTFVKSRFPKSRREKWFTLIPDSGFGSPESVFEVIALVISRFTENLRSAGESVRREIARIEEVKKNNVTAEEVKSLVSDAAASALVSGRKNRKTGKKFAVNIDTLSAEYAADDVVDIENLKARGIVPKSTKQIKILARGMLDKPLTVIADDFSADAVKMIVLTGGEAIWA